MRDSIIQALDYIELDNFDLYNLDFMIGQKWMTLSKIHINNNHIESLDLLNNYDSL